MATLGGAANLAWVVARLPDHPDADISHFMHWTRVIAVRGVEEAYAGVYPETYLIYPPGSAWVYRGAVEFARRVPKPDDLSPPSMAVEWMRYLDGLPLPIAPAPPDEAPAPAEPDPPAPADGVPEGGEAMTGDAPDAPVESSAPAPATPAPPQNQVPVATPRPAGPPPVPVDPSGPRDVPSGGSAVPSGVPVTDTAAVPDAIPATDALPTPDVTATPSAAPVGGTPALPVDVPAPPTEEATEAPGAAVPGAGDPVPPEPSPPEEAPVAEAPVASSVRTEPVLAFTRLAFEPGMGAWWREGEGSGDVSAPVGPDSDAAKAVDATTEGDPPPAQVTPARPAPVRSVPGLDDAWLRVAVKLMPVAGHVALAGVLFVVVAVASGRFWRGWLAMATYAWNPGPIFDTAYWGQGDSIHTLLLLAATGAAFAVPGWWPLRGASGWRVLPQVVAPLGGAVAGALVAAAALTKPQAWVFMPFVLWIIWKRTGPFGTAAFGAAAGAAALVIVRPWQEAGVLADALSVFAALTQVMPSVSANGHNLWWLKLGPGAIAVYDSLPVGGIGPILLPGHLTFATVGRLGFGALALLAALRLTGPLNVRVAVTSLAYVASAYFMTITQVHENHQFAAVPFLAAAAALDLAFLPVFLATSFVMFTNMAIHDFLWGAPMTALYLERLPWLARLGVVDGGTLQMANAWLNVGTFGLFSLTFLFRPTTPGQSASYLVWRARLTMVAGLALGGGACFGLWRLINDRMAAEAVWQLLAISTQGVPLIDRHLGLVTTPGARLGRAAVEFVNLYYVLGGVAAIVCWAAAMAGATWSLQSMWRRRHERRDEALARAAFRELLRTGTGERATPTRRGAHDA